MKLFDVPITREDGPRETYSSEVEVIVCPQKVSEPLRVERVKLKLHNSVDQYEVYKSGFGFLGNTGKPKDYIWFVSPLVKLGRVAPETPVLVKVDPSRPQRCFFQGGQWHAIFTLRSMYSFSQSDRVYLNFTCGDFNNNAWFNEVREAHVPTCPDCLAEEWLPFVVAAYEMPEKVRKIQDKEAAERRFRASIPTRFERIDADDEEKEPEVPLLIVDTESDPDEPVGREAKLEARVRHAKHVEAAIIQKRSR
jgi:hypothetical protein